MQFGPSFIDSLLRWAHILAGITWIGHLYFFNFVNGPLQKGLDGETKKKVVPGLMYRALFWFRWGAMFTLIFGVALFLYGWSDSGTGVYKSPIDGSLLGRGKFIMYGMTLGVIMWFNVWFIIWPAQQKIIPAVASGQAPPAGLPQRAALFSKINTYLSGPMLMLMIFAPHHGAFHYAHLGIAMVVGLAAIHCLYLLAPKVKA